MFEKEFLAAATCGDIAVIKEHLMQLDNVWITSHQALLKAVKSGHLPIVMFLYEQIHSHPKHKEHSNIKLSDLMTLQIAYTFNNAYKEAIKHGHLEIVRFLSSHQGLDHQLEFSVAVERGHLEIVKFLCTIPNVNPAYKHDLPLRFAAEKGHLPVVQFLCTLPEIDSAAHWLAKAGTHETSISIAASKGHLPIVEFLCAKLIITPKRELFHKVYCSHTIRDAINCAFINAIENGHLPVVQSLCTHAIIDWQPALSIATGDIAEFLRTFITAKCIAAGRGIRSIPKIPSEIAGKIINFLYPENSKFVNVTSNAYRAKSAPRPPLLL